MNIVEVRYFPKFGQILVRHFVKDGSDMGQIFVNFGQIFRLSTLPTNYVLFLFWPKKLGMKKIDKCIQYL